MIVNHGPVSETPPSSPDSERWGNETLGWLTGSLRHHTSTLYYN